MTTTLNVDEKLVEEARAVGGHKTPDEAVASALEEYIHRHKRHAILDMMGTVDFDPEFDYKACRRGRSVS